ncbi:hypothetical protein ACFVVL_29730 [Kitasatospora sp. NPDC058115]|uniref:hypothetical protein n=1 Tax=Kitasatospora sp. NPDC058115 TaxID=3346347 RepID=UPI0036DE2F0F
MSQAEYTSIKAAQSTIRSFGGGWGWNRILLGFQTVGEELQRCIAATEKASGTLNSSDRESLRLAYVKCAKQICDWVNTIADSTDIPVSVNSVSWTAAVTHAKSLLASGQPGSHLLKIAEKNPSDLVEIVTVAGSSERLTLRKEALESAGIETSRDWLAIPLLRAALQGLELLAARDLDAHGGAIQDSARKILSLYAEAIYGSVNLAPAEQFTPENLKSATQISLEFVDNAGVEPLVRALETARKMVSVPNAGTTQSLLEVPSPAASHGPSDETSRGSQSSSDGDVNHPVADLGSLLSHVAKLADETEIAWSASLATESRAEILGNWNSFLSGFKEVLEHRSKSTTVDQRILPKFPLDSETLVELVRSTDFESSLTGLLTAELYSLTSLINAMQGLKAPVNARLNLATGEETSWWASGAFSLVHSAANELVQVEGRVNSARQSTGAEVKSSTAQNDLLALDSLIENILRSQRALNNGLVEASLFYCAAAFRILSQTLNEEEIAIYVSELTDDQNQGHAAALAVQFNDLMASGEKVDYAKIALLAHYWVPKLGELARAKFNADLSRGASE